MLPRFDGPEQVGKLLNVCSLTVGGGKRTCRATQLAATFPRNLTQAKEMTASKNTLQAAHVKQFTDLLRSIEPWQHKTCRISIPEFVPAHNCVVALCANHKFMSLLFHMSPLCKQWVSTPCKVPGAYEHKAHRDITQFNVLQVHTKSNCP